MSKRSRMYMCAPLSVIVFCCGCMPESQSEKEAMNPIPPQMAQPNSGGVTDGRSSSEAPSPRPVGGQVNSMSDLEDSQPSQQTPTPSQMPSEDDDGSIEVKGAWRVEDDVPSGANDSIITDTKMVSDTEWDSIAIVFFDNLMNFAVIQSGENDPLNAGLFNRVEWTEPSGGKVNICHVAQGLSTIEDAKRWASSADQANLDTGCNGFPWTRWVRAE